MPEIATVSKTVLVVEDEIFLSHLLRNRLTKEGINVLLARDGEEAVKILKSEKPDLILLDLILPKKSGFEVLEQIQADPLLQRAPTIIISNLGQETDIKRGRSLGAIEYFVKAQTSIDDLIQKIKAFLKMDALVTKTWYCIINIKRKGRAALAENYLAKVKKAQSQNLSMMKKTELAEAVQKSVGLETKKQAEATVEAVFDTIAKAMARGDAVNVAGFGVFRVAKRAARMGINPKTGEKIHIPAKTAPKFRASKALKEAVL